MHETLLEKSRARLISCGDLSFAPETSLAPTVSGGAGEIRTPDSLVQETTQADGIPEF